MWEALREGLDEEMERDPTVCLMGAPQRCCCPPRQPYAGTRTPPWQRR